MVKQNLPIRIKILGVKNLMLFQLCPSGSVSILQVRCPVLNFYVLQEQGLLYLFDAGFVGGEYFLRRELKRVGWDQFRITGIIITHGHIDHILNVCNIAKKYQAWIAAPELDLPHYLGRPNYHGWSRVTDILETIGRPVLGFKPFVPDKLLHDGDQLDLRAGLQAIYLPGHTSGHTGYYLPKYKLLLSADLFASYGKFAHFPPMIFNSAPEMIPQSVVKALSLDLVGILPNHGDKATPAEHLSRLKRMTE